MTTSTPSVLIVDDEPMLREALAKDFRKMNYTVFTAEGGRSALALFIQEKIDLIITDITMPNGDGIELLQTVKGIDPFRPSVIFVTGLMDFTEAEAFGLGADAIFSKPFNRRDLMTVVERCLLPRTSAWKSSPEIFDSALLLELQLEEFQKAFQQEFFLLGRGGVSLRMKSDLELQTGQKVRLKVTFASGEFTNLLALGLVRWVKKGEEGHWSCGIEFIHLNDSCRIQVLDLIEKTQCRSYIPLLKP